MAKAGLSNNLIGRYIAPIWQLEHLFKDAKWIAEIVAAWTDEGHVMVQAVDDAGKNIEVAVSNVLVFQDADKARLYVDKLNHLKELREEAIQEQDKDRILQIETDLKDI